MDVWWANRENRIRIKYRYGENSIENHRWVKRCTILMSSIKMIETSLTMSRISTVSEGISHSTLLDRWDKEINDMIGRNAEWSTVPFGS